LNEGKVVSVEEYLMGYDDKLLYIKCCRKNVINMDKKIIRPQELEKVRMLSHIGLTNPICG
jgi:hypothetical protein